TDPEAVSVAALILSAIQDKNPRVSLDDIYSALCQSRSESHLDPLSILPHVLQSRQPAAKSIISLIGECGSSKEIVIAVQESLERIADDLALEPDEDEIEHESASDQLISLILLCSSGMSYASLFPTGEIRVAIPRLKLRKKSPETIRTLLSQLESTVHLAGPHLSRVQGREIIGSVSQLVLNILSWTGDSNAEDAATCQDMLKRLLDSTISDCSHCIQSSLAQRSFETLYPRLIIRSRVMLGWEGGEEVINDASTAYVSCGRTFADESLPPSPTVAYLVLISHSKTLPSDINQLLSFMLPILVASIQTTHALDEALSLLLRSLHVSHFPVGQQLSPDIAGTLCALLPSLASGHPDEDIRHQAFRILSQTLSLMPPELRIQILKDLTTDTQYPQMRAASVGLVKEALLDALSRENAPNIFASPIFLQVFGPVLLRPEPVDLFHSELSLSDIEDSPEPSRLVECLSLYYILLLRDKSNQTGIRDRDQISNVERTLLGPLRSTLLRWTDDPAASHEHMHAIMPLVSLKTSLERVDSAIANLRLQSLPV
ncbi:hypothetical protein GGX14DRAFT_366396, partial [Mycena pura]